MAHRHAGVVATRAGHERRTWAVAALSVLAVVGQLAAARWTGSSALAAEALHMGAHVSAFALAGLAYLAARRLEAAGRLRAAAAAPDAAALVNGLLLLVLGLDLALASLRALSHPHLTALPVALSAASVGLVVNAISAALLQHDHAHEAGHGRDVNFGAVRLHVLGDLAVAVLALVGLGLGRLFGWGWTDGAAGLAGAALVVVLGAQVTGRSVRYLRRDAGPGAPRETERPLAS